MSLLDIGKSIQNLWNNVTHPGLVSPQPQRPQVNPITRFIASTPDLGSTQFGRFLNSNAPVNLPQLPSPVANFPLFGGVAQGFRGLLNPISNGIFGTGLDITRGIAGAATGQLPTTINYNTAKSAPARLGMQLGAAQNPRYAQAMGVQSGLGQTLGNVGGIATPFANLAMLAGGPETGVAKSIGGAFLKSAIPNAALGAVSGISSGLDQQRGKGIGNQLLEAGKQGAQSAAISGLVGGGFGAGGYTLGVVSNAVKNLFPNSSKADVVKMTAGFLRDEAGRFVQTPHAQPIIAAGQTSAGDQAKLDAGKWTSGRAPKVNDAIREYLQQNNGLPKDYQSGAIQLGTRPKDNPAIIAQDIAQGTKAPLINESPSQMLGLPERPQGTTISNVAAPKKTGLVDLFFNRTRNVIAQQGPAGQELAQRLQQARDIGETSAGQWVSQLPTVHKLSNADFTNFVDVAEGKAQPANPVVAQAAQEWNTVRQNIYQRAQQSGLDIGQLQNYFPHRYDPKMFEGDNFMKAVDHLVQTGQAATPQDAAAKLRFAQDTIRNRRQGNLEMNRMVDLPGYEKTKQALFDYVEQAGHRIGQVTALGQNDSTAMGLLQQIGSQGGDANAAKEAFDIASGAKKYSSSSQAISGTLRKIQSTTKLGFGAISNVGQSVNTGVVTGGLRTLMSVPKAFSQQGRDFALKSGVTLDGVLSDLKEGGGFTGKVLSKITAPGFNTVEKFNRVLAAWSGKGYAEDLARQAAGGSKSALNELSKMGLDAQSIAQRGVLSEAEQIKAARNIVERTQFKVDPQDLPGWASSPYGKLFAQFKTFSYNQSAFVKREIVDTAMKGNVMPLIRMIVLGTVIGEGVGDAKAFARQRQRPQDATGRVVDNLNTVGGGGTIQDAYNAASRGPAGVMSFIAGPAVGDVSNWVGGAGLALQGKPKTIAKTALSEIPIAGQTISNTIFPPKNAYKSRTPDLPIDQASAADLLPPTTPKALTPVETANIKAKISDINKQQQAILKNTGTTLPIVGQLGGLTTDQMNQKLATLDAQKKALQDQIKTPSPTAPMNQAIAGNTLTEARAKSANDLSGYIRSVQAQIDALGQYEKGLNPQTDQTQMYQLQKRIESLTAIKDKYTAYGGFTKPKKGKKIKVSLNTRQTRISIPKISAPKMTVSASKVRKAPTFKIKAPKKSSLKLSVPKFQQFRNPMMR